MLIVIDDEKIIDLLETEWGYDGIREDITRVIRESGTSLPKVQADVLDKIRAEIENVLSDGMIHKQTVLGIIDKYRESEE